MLENALRTFAGGLSRLEVWLRDPVSALAVLLGMLALITLVSRVVFRWQDPGR